MFIPLLPIPRLLVVAGLTAFGLQALAIAQVMEGRLSIRVSDPGGGAVAAHVRLVGRNPEFVAAATADETGQAVIKRVPPRLFQLIVRHPGFETFSAQIEIRSAVPQSVQVVLQIGMLHETVTVENAAPLLDPLQPSNPVQVGRLNLNRVPGTTLGRSTIDIVTTLPGWLLEANAVLHPRGSEYDTQYVIDGMPLYDNRSIAFAPGFENDEFEAVNVLTAGIPAEYGRRLGGVIALDTRRADGRGHHTALDLQGGGHGTYFGSMSHQYAADRTTVSAGLQVGRTDRYLDPPSLENFTNKASSGGFNARLAHDISPRDQLTVYLRYNRSGFLVPNDLEQQAAGQRQDRQMGELAGQVHYQKTISGRSVGSVRGMVRELSGRLRSNPLATPVHVQQDRGFREAALVGDLTVDHGWYTVKFGGDVRVNDIREMFQLADPGELTRPILSFHDQRRSTELGLFVQNQVRLGNFVTNLGVRLDGYRLLVVAVSPRAALSYYVPKAEIQMFAPTTASSNRLPALSYYPRGAREPSQLPRSAEIQMFASYDRIFQPPPMENLLLSSGGPALGIDAVEGTLADRNTEPMKTTSPSRWSLTGELFRLLGRRLALGAGFDRSAQDVRRRSAPRPETLLADFPKLHRRRRFSFRTSGRALGPTAGGISVPLKRYQLRHRPHRRDGSPARTASLETDLLVRQPCHPLSPGRLLAVFWFADHANGSGANLSTKNL